MTLTLFIGAILQISLGLLVLIKHKNKATKAYFFGITLCLFIWTLSFMFLNTKTVGSNISTLLKLAWAGVISMPYFFIKFALHFPKYLKTKINNTLIIPTVIFLALIPTNFLFHAAYINIEGQIYIERNIGNKIIAIYAIIYWIIPFILLKKQYSKSNNKDKNRIKYIFGGLVVSLLTGLTTNLFIPLTTGITTFKNGGPLSCILFTSITTYAILKHQLFDINIAIKKSATFSILFALLLSMMMALNNYLITKLQLPLIWNMTIFVIVGLTSYGFLSRIVNKITENIFIKKKHNFKDIIDLSENLKLEQSISNERKKYSELLQEKNDELAEANLELINMIEKQKKAQQIIVSQSKEAVIGRIAGGIAHEFKNPLAMQLELIENLKDDPQLIHHFYDRAKQSISHCFSITKVLLNSFHSKEVKQTTIDLSEIVKETIILFEMSIKNRNITIETDLTPCNITGSRADLQQVIMNILSNAKDAIKDTGTIKISLRKEGTHTSLEISDDGHGMTKETMKNIYDPFFTTKEVGSGTGIGLYLVKQIIDKHNAAIDCKSTEYQGATFTIRFP